ncbi:hypothetical protein HELRODRAFT_183667 [Helobdella robusta]|uniref:Glucose-methanol-choline oxidoreductase N-terminal domain-containing protein n=1 Tax=Helobdella robusta TaxID=6412 RepID=T1FK05_HELRO|nr:hypothetical protein HELRODRAFT_183667 [Helobdella robusta]ESO10390.1 hypothetical protein HELRODRAFT_183667 [Helobdella robusta]
MYSAKKCIDLSNSNIQQMIKRFIGKSANISEHDYIVVGSGSAGSVIANRLATFNSPDKSSNQVLLLEAGPSDDTWKIKMPAALMYCLKDKKYSWCYETTPQPRANNRVFFWPRGKVMGGSSSLNAMVYVRGHPYDYDRWEQEGAKGWSYADCLPYFKKAQTHQLGGDDYRGDSGPLYVSRGKWNNPLYHAFVDAGLQAGYQHTEDCNGFKQEGFGHFDMTIKNGVRCNASMAYIHPILSKYKNLKISTNSMATKVIVEGSKAVGVEYKQNDATKYARARKEVILCGGSINSPQLLLLSGIGNADELRNFVRSTSETAYHPCGTAKMGSENDKSAVVDSKCRVLGIDKLRVVDASIMPSILSGNLNAPVIMMAEKAADMILGVPPLPKLHVPVWKPSDPTKQR